MITFLISLILISMLYFINTLFFTLCLILMVIVVSMYSVYLGSFSSLFSIMLIIIYVGAMIIFIGYICAISPNILFKSSFPYRFTFLPFLLVFLLFPSVPSFNSNFSPLTDYLYSSTGFYLFFLVALVLFLVLMVVSSQFFRPQGPFRSVG